jgi:hypothetical protein
MSTPMDKFTEAKNKILAEQIKNIHDSLTSISAQDITSLPEPVFVNSFLPFFAGQTVTSDINVSTWVGIAGNPYRSVNIVGANGEVLYTIPPLFDREALDPNKRQIGVSPMQHVMKTYEQFMQLSPQRARSYLDQELAKRNLAVDARENIISNLHIWNAIFARYNLPLIQGGPQSPSTSASSSDKVDLDYSDEIL